MPYLDTVQQKRLEAQQQRASQDLHKESIGAVTGSGKEIVGATSKLAKSQDIDSLIAQVKEVQLAAMLGASKPSIVLTDQTDLGDKMAALGSQLAEAVKSIDTTKLSGEQLTKLTDLKTGLDKLSSTFTSGVTTASKQHKELLSAIKALKLDTVVNVPEPKVTVKESKVDFKPLQDTIREYFKAPEVEKIDLECYRAQDIKDSDNMQYVGFVNPDGGWYIIENDVKANKLRYVFGMGNYEKAFKKAATYQYMLLNEAIDALQT